MTAPILVLNSGSSSLKLAVFTQSDNDEQLLFAGSADGIGRADGSIHLRAADNTTLLQQDHTLESQAQALQHLTDALRPHLPDGPIAIGHRVVHGGPHLREHQRITPAVLATLEASLHFAPLHIPDALNAIRQAEQIYPEAAQIACFDTAFHRTMPLAATRLPIPERFAAQGVQRYGFHGLSCESILHRLRSHLSPRIIIAHLGGGCSVTAVRDGRSVDTTMGMSPSGGVPMATRSGDLDPAVLLFLLRSGLNPDALEHLVNHECGLAGLADGESDMQALLRRADAGDTAAMLAIDIFCTDIRKAIGAFIALLGGIDLLVFTGGIGEHSAVVRTRILEGLQTFGLTEHLNPNSTVIAMPAEEEIQIARQCRRLLQATPS